MLKLCQLITILSLCVLAACVSKAAKTSQPPAPPAGFQAWSVAVPNGFYDLSLAKSSCIEDRLLISVLSGGQRNNAVLVYAEPNPAPALTACELDLAQSNQVVPIALWDEDTVLVVRGVYSAKPEILLVDGKGSQDIAPANLLSVQAEVAGPAPSVAMPGGAPPDFDQEKAKHRALQSALSVGFADSLGNLLVTAEYKQPKRYWIGKTSLKPVSGIGAKWLAGSGFDRDGTFRRYFLSEQGAVYKLDPAKATAVKEPDLAWTEGAIAKLDPAQRRQIKRFTVAEGVIAVRVQDGFWILNQAGDLHQISIKHEHDGLDSMGRASQEELVKAGAGMGFGQVGAMPTLAAINRTTIGILDGGHYRVLVFKAK